MTKTITIRHRRYRPRPEAIGWYYGLGLVGGTLLAAGLSYGLLMLVLIAG